MAKLSHNVPKRSWSRDVRPSQIVLEWRREEARETLREIARQEGLDWLVREVLGMVRSTSS